MIDVELMRSAPSPSILRALRDAIFDTVALLTGLPQTTEPPLVQVILDVEERERDLGLNIFVPEASRAAVEGPGGATLEAMSRIAHEVAARGWGGSAEVLLFSPPPLEEIDGVGPGDQEVLGAQRRQVAGARVALTVQDWLVLLVRDEEDVRASYRYDQQGTLLIGVRISDPEERVLFEASETLTGALCHLTERLGEAVGIRAGLRFGGAGRGDIRRAPISH